jgi:hypothetical protein
MITWVSVAVFTAALFGICGCGSVISVATVTSRSRGARPDERGVLMEILTDLFVVVGVVAAVGAGVLYVYLADRMVSGR